MPSPDDPANAPDSPDKPAAEGDEGNASSEQAAETGAPPKKTKKKLVVALIIVGLVAVAGGGGGAFIGFYKPAQKSAAAKVTTEPTASDDKKLQEDLTEPDEHAGPAKLSVFAPLGDILVNLSGDGKHPHFLKMKVSIELTDPKDIPRVEAMQPRIVDNFQAYLRELRVEDLRGSAGLYRLREELLLRVNEILQPLRARDVLFQEMLVQ